jgi:putative restriction endonuclease
MIKAYVGVTDRKWFDLLRSQPSIDEVNFWQPSGGRNFQAIRPGELFLFKLHRPDDFIVGGGIFAHFSLLPISLAWEAFQVGNGALDLFEMRTRVEKYRRVPPSAHDDYTIGCILLEQPFFLPREQWIPIPQDWSPNIVQGKTYDLTVEPGRTIWTKLQTRQESTTSSVVRETEAAFGEPVLVQPRLGQGAFRILVTDGYERRCAFTGERTLPVLDAAHIRPFSQIKEHRLDNGLLLRKDLHALFDRGYMTVTPTLKIEVSKRIKEEFSNGREYYRLHGQEMRPPAVRHMFPSSDSLVWHNEKMFKS